MKRMLITLLFIIACPAFCFAQASGNVGYSQSSGHTKAEQNERAKRAMTKEEMPPTGTSMFIEASVLMNAKADEYVAIFGISQECATVPECGQKMDATISQLTQEFSQLGISRNDMYVDLATQNKIYAYQIVGDVAKERLVGFELKKNISVHYKDPLLLDKLMLAAARSKVFDLIKVDYIVRDTPGVHNRMMDEAAAVIKQKLGRYEKLLGIKLQAPAQVYAEKSGMYFPSELYDSYTAFESEEISSDYYRQRYTLQGARKSRTFFFNGLNADGFDSVINPVVIEPVVQFTLYLKVKYEIAQPRDK